MCLGCKLLNVVLIYGDKSPSIILLWIISSLKIHLVRVNFFPFKTRVDLLSGHNVQAILGGTVQVPTLSGDVVLKVTDACLLNNL